MLTAGTEDAVPPQGLGVGSWHWDIVRGGFRWSQYLRLIYGITADADLGVEAFVAAEKTRAPIPYRQARRRDSPCAEQSRAPMRWQGPTGLAHRRRHRSWERHRSGYARGWQSVRCWRD